MAPDCVLLVLQRYGSSCLAKVLEGLWTIVWSDGNLGRTGKQLRIQGRYPASKGRGTGGLKMELGYKALYRKWRGLRAFVAGLCFYLFHRLR